jgi:hypothetical protein
VREIRDGELQIIEYRCNALPRARIKFFGLRTELENAVLADVLGRDGAELSASAVRQRNLVGADHLAILNAIWTAETQAARHDRYRELVTAALPPGHRQPLSHQARWLFRTLHAAELAGLDPAEVTRTAIACRDLAGARDIASVLDARIRPRVDPLLPRPQGLWAERVPHQPDPEHRAYLAKIATMMDDRKQRLGQHAAQTTPAWAITALGSVPEDAAAGRTGSATRPRSRPTGRCTAMTTPATRSAPSYAASRVPRRNRRAPAADGAWRRSGLGRPRQDVPWLAGIRPGCDIAAGDLPSAAEPPVTSRDQRMNCSRLEQLQTTNRKVY